MNRQLLRYALIAILLVKLNPAHAVWEVIDQVDSGTNTTTQVAFTKNEAGYSLQIYRDDVDAIRARFSINRNLDLLAKRHCPTFQVDSRLLDNRSINDAPCITNVSWSEFVLGYVRDNVVNSAKLNALVNGNTITFRYMLENGAYEETSFSLLGSKRSTLTVIGGDITISP